MRIKLHKSLQSQVLFAFAALTSKTSKTDAAQVGLSHAVEARKIGQDEQDEKADGGQE